MRALQIRVTNEPLLTIRRSKRWKKRLVYILAANVSFKYKSGERSYIIYIGTTGKGGRRPATSASDKASEAFYELRGVKEIRVHIATCKGRKRIKTWEHLESALLAVFTQMHWELPKYNKRKGDIANPRDIKLFSKKALEKMILKFAES
ncbi:MAG: hypothetical protein ACRD4S_13245 [Candidatus Acidiferrales bacterium]